MKAAQTKPQTPKRGKKNKRRGARYWIVSASTMGALVAFTIGNSRAVALGYTRDLNRQTAHVKLHAASRQLQDQQISFDIAAGTLGDVLDAFQKATGWQINVTNSTLRAIASPGVKGLFTPEQALQKLLDGTGVSYEVMGAAATLEIQAQAGTVEVRDTGSGRISSPKYTEPLRDIPQTITIIPQAVIEQQGATTLRDVLRNVPGLTIAAGEGGVPAGDNLTLRGFSARNDIFVDGSRDLGPQSRDPFDLEQVEVVKGPSSTFAGRGSTGGTINLVSKTPGLARFFSGTFNLGTDHTKRLTGDINLPIRNSIAFRLNLLGHESDVAGRDIVESERWGIAPSIAFGIGTPTRYIFSYFKLKQDNLSDYGIPWVPVTNNALVAFRDRPAPVPRSTFYGFKNRDFEKLDSDLLTFRFEHDFNDNLSLRSQLRYGDSTRDSFATPPRFNNNNSTLINRELRSWKTEDEIVDNQTDLTARFSTGRIGHAVSAGIALTRENNIRFTRTGTNVTTTLLNPNPNDTYTGTITTSPIVGDITANSFAVYGFDTVRLNRQWEVVGGLRWDYFDVEGVSTTGVPVSRIDRLLSGRLGLVYKPVERGSFYGAYGTSLNPSLEGLSYSVVDARVDPEKTRTFEVGSKWDFFRNRLLLSGAAFRVEKTNARTPGILPGDLPIVLQGEQQVDGIELSVTGGITRQWYVFAAYTLLDSEIVSSNTPAEVGRRILNTPRNSLSFWSTYRLRKLEFGGGARYTDRRFGNNINTRIVDDYWLFDTVVSYPIKEKITLRLNLYNLTDKYYFDRIGGGHVVPGAGRSAMFSTSFRF